MQVTCQNRISIKDKFLPVRCGDEAVAIIIVCPQREIRVCSDCLRKYKMTIFKLDSILTFGKYKGFSVQEVVDDDSSYLAWAIDEIEWFDLR